MKVQDFFSMPQFVMPTSFNLDDARFNRQFASKLLKSKDKRIIKSYSDTVHLYEFNTGYAMIDRNGPSVWYYVKFKVFRNTFIGKLCVQQIKVWRQFRRDTEGIAKSIFFNFLLPKFGCMITDAEQTSEGQRFWYNRISDAFKTNHYVYFVSLIPHRIIKRIAGFEDLDKIEGIAWDWHHKNQAKRLIITDSPLKEVDETPKSKGTL